MLIIVLTSTYWPHINSQRPTLCNWMLKLRPAMTRSLNWSMINYISVSVDFVDIFNDPLDLV